MKILSYLWPHCWTYSLETHFMLNIIYKLNFCIYKNQKKKNLLFHLIQNHWNHKKVNQFFSLFLQIPIFSISLPPLCFVSNSHPSISFTFIGTFSGTFKKSEVASSKESVKFEMITPLFFFLFFHTRSSIVNFSSILHEVGQVLCRKSFMLFPFLIKSGESVHTVCQKALKSLGTMVLFS